MRTKSHTNAASWAITKPVQPCSPIQWTDMKAAEAIAYAAIAAIKKHPNYPTPIVIGGPHYRLACSCQLYVNWNDW